MIQVFYANGVLGSQKEWPNLKSSNTNAEANAIPFFALIAQKFVRHVALDRFVDNVLIPTRVLPLQLCPIQHLPRQRR